LLLALSIASLLRGRYAVSEPTTIQDAEVAEPQETLVEATPVALVEDELLVEDISIDGMCGVY
jgi:mycofactocin precursor